jgi:hypothetical protein
MSKLDLTEQHDTRDHADHRVLHVLEFGIAGAHVTNALVFIYFAVVCASGSVWFQS